MEITGENNRKIKDDETKDVTVNGHKYQTALTLFPDLKNK